MDKDQIEAFQLIENNMIHIPMKFFKPMFTMQMKDIIKKRLKAKETPEFIYKYFTDEPTFVRILSYCQISLDEFKSWIK
jgi:hypothetical protein